MLRVILEPVLLDNVSQNQRIGESGATTVVAVVPPPSQTPLTAPLTISFDYSRSLGETLGEFARGLVDGKIHGNRASDGRVHVPPIEFDPHTHQRIADFVEVSSVGTVESWAWQPQPRSGNPLAAPFAWALIKLRGADTAVLHVVQANETEMATGLTVHAIWKAERTGAITDISHFEIGDSISIAPQNLSPDTAIQSILTPISLTVTHSASDAETTYLKKLKEGVLVGGHSDDDPAVYFPPREANPTSGKPTKHISQLPDTGTVTTFCIVNVPFLGQQIKPPYVGAYILLDGSDIPFLHLILDVPADEVRMGMRVKAVWRPASEWDYTIGNISHFAPLAEPDAEFDTYKDHL